MSKSTKRMSLLCTGLLWLALMIAPGAGPPAREIYRRIERF